MGKEQQEDRIKSERDRRKTKKDDIGQGKVRENGVEGHRVTGKDDRVRTNGRKRKGDGRIGSSSSVLKINF